MTDLRLDGPMTILVLLGLTLPEVSEDDLEKIRTAAGPGATIKVASQVRDAIAMAGDVEIILGFIPEALFQAAPRLRWVHAIASGVDMFLYPAMRDSHVVLTGEKGLVGGHLADTGFGLLLALTRQIAAAIRFGPASWQSREAMRRKELELEGLTMGIIGFGGTGRAMARRAVAFGMRVLALDEHPVPPSDGVRAVWSRDRLAELLAASDVVAICCPLTTTTRHLFNDAAFAQMKRGALLINVTRGEIIDGEALVRALRDGRCGGAGLDVAPLEPLPAEHPLWTFENVVMTPHTAGASQLRAARNLDRFCENLRRVRTGAPLLGVVDKQLGY
ncbi:MAG TPA: D-2-hydroxyacid dehydrogenase [Methylomirabilota bacterium]|nr:D-2-hydroxyacid dehydrogenase [Methylomirabilota bacterium]